MSIANIGNALCALSIFRKAHCTIAIGNGKGFRAGGLAWVAFDRQSAIDARRVYSPGTDERLERVFF